MMTDIDVVLPHQEDEGWFSEDTATFGDRLAAGREALGMSQSDLARRLGVKLKTLQAWEQDLSEPRANKLSMLSGVLNVSLPWLLTGEGQGLDAPEDEAPLTEDIAGLLTEMRQLKTMLSQAGEKLGGLEKRLRRALKEGRAQ